MLLSGVGILVLGIVLAGVGFQLFRTDYTTFTAPDGTMRRTVEPGDDVLFRSAGPLAPGGCFSPGTTGPIRTTRGSRRRAARSPARPLRLTDPKPLNTQLVIMILRINV